MTKAIRNWNDSIPETGRALTISDGTMTYTTKLAFDESIDEVIHEFGRTYDFNANDEPTEVTLYARYYADGAEWGARQYTITNVCPECGKLYSSTVAAHECIDTSAVPSVR